MTVTRTTYRFVAEVADFVANLKVEQPDLTTPQCVAAVDARFGIKVYRRSLERAMARKKIAGFGPMTTAHCTVKDYETLRAAVLATEPLAGQPS